MTPKRLTRKDSPKSKSSRRYIFFGIIILFFIITVTVILFNKKWDGISRFTIIIHNHTEDPLKGSLAVFSIEPKERKAVYMVFPYNTLFNVPYGYKSYMVSSIYKLGKLDSQRSAGKLLAKSTEISLGLAIDGYLVMENSDFQYVYDNEADFKKTKINNFSFIGGFKNIRRFLFGFKSVDTDMTLMVRFTLWNAIRKLRADQISYIDLISNNILQDDQLSDGTSIKKINLDRFDISLSDDFQDTNIRAENITLEIINATKQERLAAQFAMILNRLGANVISTNTSEEPFGDSCTLYGTENEIEKSWIVKKLNKLYDCMQIKKKDKNQQSEIRIVLGERFVK